MIFPKAVMITKKQKTVLFASLIATIILPLAGMDYVSGQESTIKQSLRIDEPQDSPAKIAIQQRADALFAEEAAIYAEGAPIKAKYDAEGMEALTQQEIKDLERITAEFIDVKKRIDQLNADSRALITLSQAEKDALHHAVIQIRESDIPFTGVFSDWNGEAVGVSFENQKLADEYAPIIETMIEVPFYTQIREPLILDACSSLTSDCDPLLGGVEITTDFNSTHNSPCSYSTAADRDVFWWTDYGFLTAAHCFEDSASGNDVQQPNAASGKIGDLNIWKWDTSNADCDCAFVLKSGSEMHWKAAYEGPNDSLTFGGFADPSVNDFVTIVGQNGIHTNLQVDALDWSGNANSLDSPPITHSMVDMIDMDNWGTSTGDSGGVVHATGTDPNYHGIIQGHAGSSGSTGHTIASAWSNIDAHFGLN